MDGLLGISRAIDALSDRIGKLAGWAIFAAVLVSTVNALVRFSFNYSKNSFLEAQWYLFGFVILLGASYTFQKNEHIRIDIVSSRLPMMARHWIDILGHLIILMPFCLLMTYLGSIFFMRSFASGEISSSAGGLTLWPAKLLIPAGFAMLFAQAVSELIKRVAVVRGLIPDPHAGHSVHGSVE
jgi:TRAP-type mannitol/chloroaromatic compound transport system permease small subunit